MKNIYKYAMIASAVLSLAACNDLIESSEPAVDIERAIILTATREGTNPNTRSVRMDDGTTWWGPKEEISVFYGSGSNGGSKFTSKNTTIAEITEFEGSISMSGNKEFWAVYPYSADNSCDGSSIITVIPSQQTGVEGNFSNDAFPAMGKSGSLSMPFYNICGGIKFFVSRADIKSVTFKGNNGEVLAGKVKVTFGADGKPEVAEVIEAQTEVTLTAPDGGAFKAGKYYYVTLLPGLLDGGFTMSFTTASETGTLKSDKQQTIKRSVFGTLKNIDSKVAEWESNVPIPEYVDLGLSVKWASCNVGASKPEEYGDYLAWGETEPKSNYSWSTYKFRTSGDSDDNVKFNKYCTQSSYWDSTAPMDNKTVLDPEDDAAHVNWGGSWRMPTDAEWTELMTKCTWTWTSQNEVNGRLGTGPNGNSIFLPVAGNRYDTRLNNAGSYGFYWSSSLKTGNPIHAWHVRFNSGGVSRSSYGYRYSGQSVRPVYGEFIPVSSIAINESSLSLYIGSSSILLATIMPASATAPEIIWHSSNASIVSVDLEGKINAVAVGQATITAYSSNGLSASCIVTVNNKPVPEAVDLGLSVKWATFNIGASNPYEFGDYFAWGDTETYYEAGYAQLDNPVWKAGKENGYCWASYKWCEGSFDTQKKYCTTSSHGTVDDKKVLDPEDDAAHAWWGDNWRLPTDDELLELIRNCTWTAIETNGITGYEIVSNMDGFQDKSIFIPKAGNRYGINLYGPHAELWTSSLRTDMPDRAYNLREYVRDYWECRDRGLCIRPVCPKD